MGHKEAGGDEHIVVVQKTRKLSGFWLECYMWSKLFGLCSSEERRICLKANLAALICNTNTDFVAANPDYEDPSRDAKWKTMEETRAILSASQLQLWRSSSGMP